MSQQKLYEAVRSGRVKLTDLNDDGKQALREYMSTKDKPATPKQSTYSRIDSKVGGILPGGSDFKPSEYGISDKFAKDNPAISRGLATVVSPLKAVFDIPSVERASQAGNEVRFLTENPDKTDTGSSTKNMVADFIGGATGFIGGSPGSIMPSAGGALFGGGAKATGKILPKTTRPIVRTAAEMAGGSVVYDLGNAAANGHSPTVEDLGVVAAQNALLGAATYGLGKGVSRLFKDKTEIPLTKKEVTSPKVKQDIPADINLARNVVKNTTNLGRINRIIDAYPELAAEYPQFRLQQGDKVILPNGKEATVKTNDRMIIQVDVDGKAASVGRKVVNVPEVKTEAVSEVATPEIKQQPVINDVPRVNNRSGADTFDDAVSETVSDNYNKAVELVTQNNSPSISLLQRNLKIGYAEAARHINRMESEGIVSAFDGNGRTVLKQGNKTATDIETAFNDLGNAAQEAGYKKTMDDVAKQGYVSFAKKESADLFRNDPRYEGWKEEQVNGEYRFSPQENVPSITTQIKVNRGSKGVANITLPDADHALLFELDKQMKMLNNEKTYSQELEVLAEQNYNKLKDKFPDPIGTADTYRRSVLNGAKDIEKDGTYAAETFEAVKAKLDAEAKRFDIPVDKRTSKNVGDRKVNAMQYNHPELKPHIQEQAKNIMGDLAASLKAARGGTTVYGENTGGENISFGNKRMTTNTIAKILDEQKVSYADINNALQRIIDDAGQENVALAKRIELLIDEHLTDGYTDIYGNKYPPSKEYVDAKNKAYGTDIKSKEQYKDMSDEDWAELEQLQGEIEGKGDVKQETPELSAEVGNKSTSEVKTIPSYDEFSNKVMDIYNKQEKKAYAEADKRQEKLIAEKENILNGIIDGSISPDEILSKRKELRITRNDNGTYSYSRGSKKYTTTEPVADVETFKRNLASELVEDNIKNIKRKDKYAGVIDAARKNTNKELGLGSDTIYDSHQEMYDKLYGSKTMAEDIGLKPEKADELIIEGNKVTGSAESIPGQAGTYDPGTIGAARLTVPEKQATLPGTNEKVRSFQRTAIDAPVTDLDTKAGLLVDIYTEGPGAYKSITNIETEAAARKFIEDMGEGEALRYVFDETEVSALKPAMAGQLAYALQKQGKHYTSVELLESMGKQLTSAGQMAQAVKIFMNLSPEGVLIKANKETKKAFNELPKQTKDKHDDLSGKLQEEFDGIDKEAIDQVVSETPELGGKKQPDKKGNKPGKPTTEKKEFDPAAVLAQKVVQWTKPMMPKAITSEMQMVRTLFKKAQEVLPKDKVKPVKTNALDEIATALQQSDNYRKTWEDSKKVILEQNGEIPQVMKDVEAYVEHFLNVPYSERSLSRVLVEAMKDKSFDLEQSAFGPMSPNFRGTKAENNAFIQSIVKDSGLTGKNAEVLSLELGSKLDKALKKKRDDKTSDLAKRIIGMAVDSPKGAETNPVKEMFNILMQKAKESMPKVEGAKSAKDGMLPIYNALNNRKMFNQVWSEAKKDIVKQLEAKGLSVEGVNLDQMFAELLYHPYTKGQLSREVTKGIKQYGIDVNNIVRQHFTVVDKTGQTLAEKLTTRGMLPKDEAALLAQDIQARFAEIAEMKKAQILKNMFREKSLTKEQRTIDQKIVELSNLGALSKEQYRRSVAEKMGLPVLTEDIANRLVALAEQAQLATGRRSEILRAQMLKILAEQKPVSFTRKFDALRRIAMLLNPKTLLARNIGGNAILGTFENIKDIPGSIADRATTAYLKKKGIDAKRTTLAPSVEGIATQAKGIVKGAKLVTEDIKLGVDTSPTRGQYEIPVGRTFDNKVLNFLDNATTRGLQYGDRTFFQGAYDDALRQQMKINKTDKPTPEMEDFALEVAKDRTFQNDSEVSNAIIYLRQGLNKLGAKAGIGNKEWGLGNIAIPFAKTPGNIMDKAIDYSPLGFISAAKEAYRGSKGEFNQKKFVDAIGRAVTGTGLILLGYDLARSNVITGQQDKNSNVASFKKNLGMSPYSYNMSAAIRLLSGEDPKPKKGDVIRTYDFAQPISVALAVGADIYSGIKNRKRASNLVAESIKSGGNALLKQSVLQGLTRMVGGYDTMQGVLDTIFQAPLQFIPTVSGQIAKITDKNARETRSQSMYEEVINKGKAKIPGLSSSLPKKVDTLGRDIESISGGNTFFNSFINPGLTKKFNPSEVEQRVLDVYEKTGDASILPRVADSSFKVNRINKKSEPISIDLTGQEMSDYQKNMGTKVFEGYSKLSPKMRPEIAVKRMKSILDSANEYAKIQLLKSRGYVVVKRNGGVVVR